MSIIRSTLAFLAITLASVFSLLPRLLTMSPELAVASSVIAIVAGLSFLLLARPAILVAKNNFLASGQVKPGLFVLMLFLGIATTFAAGNIESSITSLTIRPSGTRNSDTNGLIRLFSANESNFFAITTNLDFVFATANGTFTGRTHSQIFTNINDTASRSTNSWKSGILVATNGLIAQ